MLPPRGQCEIANPTQRETLNGPPRIALSFASTSESNPESETFPPRSNAMLLIEDLGFPLAHDLKLVALQGDCGLREDTAATGGRYVVDDAGKARAACLSLIERARVEK